MKDGYRYKDGKIIVSDYNSDNGNVRQEIEREYQDNISDVLITENVIEYLNYLKKQASVSEYTIKKIEEEILRQEEMLKKLNNDKRKDNEVSLAYDSEYKWVTDYIRLNYVDKIKELEKHLLDTVELEEIKNQHQEQSGPRLVKKLTPPKYTGNK